MEDGSACAGNAELIPPPPYVRCRVASPINTSPSPLRVSSIPVLVCAALAFLKPAPRSSRYRQSTSPPQQPEPPYHPSPVTLAFEYVLEPSAFFVSVIVYALVKQPDIHAIVAIAAIIIIAFFHHSVSSLVFQPIFSSRVSFVLLAATYKPPALSCSP